MSILLNCVVSVLSELFEINNIINEIPPQNFYCFKLTWNFKDELPLNKMPPQKKNSRRKISFIVKPPTPNLDPRAWKWNTYCLMTCRPTSRPTFSDVLCLLFHSFPGIKLRLVVHFSWKMAESNIHKIIVFSPRRPCILQKKSLLQISPPGYKLPSPNIGPLKALGLIS